MSVPCRLPLVPTASQKLLSQETGSFTHALIGLFHSDPAEPTSRSLIASAVLLMMPKNTSRGNRMATASTLKKSCTVAAANARRNSLDCRMWPSDTSVLVTVVPMFAPIAIGTASSTPSLPVATRPTMIEVDAEEDCTRIVPRMPMHRAAMGLPAAENRRSVVSSPMILMPDSSDDTPTRNA